VAGRDSLSKEHTATGVLGQMAVTALDRLILERRKGGTPFSLSVHFNAPHREFFFRLVVVVSAY